MEHVHRGDIVRIKEDDMLMMIVPESQYGTMRVVGVHRLMDADDIEDIREVIIRRTDRESFVDINGVRYETVSVLEDMLVKV